MIKNYSRLTIFFVILLLALSVRAIQPTQEQIDKFRELSPGDQRAILESVGINVGGGSSFQKVPKMSTQVGSPAPRNKSDSPSQQNQIESAYSTKDNESTDKVKVNTLIEDQKSRDESHSLKPFGYELFASQPTTFAPIDNAPVPANYVVGPGDTVMVQLYGKESSYNEILVDREGSIQFPNIGPVSVIGLNFKELKERIDSIVSQQMIGVQASVSMGALRSIQVFVLGEAYKPGVYTVSSLSTITNALFASGGVNTVASLRNIQLKRSGKIIGKLDLYDLLLEGNTKDDKRLLPGDVIFIPPVGKTAGIFGEIKRPAIYEIKDERNIVDLIALAGGTLPTAYLKTTRIDRIVKGTTRNIVDIDLDGDHGVKSGLEDGDLVRIYSILDKVENAVLVRGHVHRPGGFEWKLGLRVSDLLGSYTDLLPNVDLSYALIKREKYPIRKTETISFNLGEAISNKGAFEDRVLKARDELIVFSASKDKRSDLKDVLSALKSETEIGEYPKVVQIKGSVTYPGEYPLTLDMTLYDLVSAASGFRADTSTEFGLIARRTVGSAKISVSKFSLKRDVLKRLQLEPLDSVYIFEQNRSKSELMGGLVKKLKEQASHDEGQQVVGLSGSIRFPGEYPYLEGMTLQELIELAGGMKEEAYTLEAEITRQSISPRQEFKTIHVRIDGVEGGLGNDTLLEPKDRIVIKRKPNWERSVSVELKGEVRFPGIYPVANGEKLSSVIKRAGGITDFSDPDAAIFLRDSLRIKEQKMLSRVKRQLEKELYANNVVGGVGRSLDNEKVIMEQKLLGRLKEAAPSGRLVIDLKKVLQQGSGYDVDLKDKDLLILPKRIQEVSVLGEVNFPTSLLFLTDKNVGDYIAMSGGVTNLADKRRAYIIRKNGEVLPASKRTLVILRKYQKVYPGDTIVIPIESNRVHPLEYWKGISQILFQLATTAAALDTVGAL